MGFSLGSKGNNNSHGNSSCSNENKNKVLVTAVASSICTLLVTTVVTVYHQHHKSRLLRSAFQDAEEHGTHQSTDALHSVLSHFRDLHVDTGSTVEVANRRRTQTYYEKARQAHENTLVRGVAGPPGVKYGFSYYWQFHSHFVKTRRQEYKRIMRYYTQGTQSHRTLVIMCDLETSELLEQARHDILKPLDYDTNVQTKGVWIPDVNIIPKEDMHVTVATPWWWHTIHPHTDQTLSADMANRVQQTLVLKMHFPFVIELERIVLLGGKTLVALWRCVGERTTKDGTVLLDRHGTGLDPFVRVREEIVRCFTTGTRDGRRVPLTYQEFRMRCMNDDEDKDDADNDDHHNENKQKDTTAKDDNTKDQPQQQQQQSHNTNQQTQPPSSPPPKTPPPTTPNLTPLKLNPPKLERQDTIGDKTPGMASQDGFIHTTLCRFPALDCLCPTDVDLSKIHRLCREVSASLAGHRMVVRRYRFLETTGAGGESNPCVDPIFDKTIEAPIPAKVDRDTSKILELDRNYIAADATVLGAWSEEDDNAAPAGGVGGGGSGEDMDQPQQAQAQQQTQQQQQLQNLNQKHATIGPVRNYSRPPLITEDLFEAPGGS